MAGADANLYLVMAAIFAGILHGLDNELPLQEEVEGDGLEQEAYPSRFARAMPWVSLSRTITCAPLFRRTACHVYHACKNDELLQFERLITETEIEWMLKNA